MKGRSIRFGGRRGRIGRSWLQRCTEGGGPVQRIHVLGATVETLEHFALQGAEQALEAVEVARGATNLGLRPAGIVVNRVRRSTEHAYRLDELRRAYPNLVLSPPIPDRAAMAASQGAAAPITSMRSSGAQDLRRLFSELSANIEEALS